MKKMPEVSEAWELLQNHIPAPEPTEVRLENARGFILAEPVIADQDYPIAPRVCMDGIAVKVSAISSKHISIAGVQKAGAKPMELPDNPDTAIEVMTGAILPENADCVIRFEDLNKVDETTYVLMEKSALKSGAHIHPTGKDYQRGQVLLKPGLRLGATETSICAAVGKTLVGVHKKPVAGIIVTGDEVVPLDTVPLPWQVRANNAVAVQNCLEDFDIKTKFYGIVSDDPLKIESVLENAIQECDVVLLTGGVSMGIADLVPQCLMNKGVRPILHKIRQKPGKPIWIGSIPNKKMIFGLPGNPVSALACLARYVLPAIQKMQGANFIPLKSALNKELELNNKLTHFIPACLRISRSGYLKMDLMMTKGSGDFASLTGTQGIAVIPPGQGVLAKEEVFEFYPWKPLTLLNE